MSSIKKAKKAKKVKTVKSPKQPKAAFKQKLTKEDKFTLRQAKKLMKEAMKRKQQQRKRVDTIVGVTAVVLCVVSAVLDLISICKKKD